MAENIMEKKSNYRVNKNLKKGGIEMVNTSDYMNSQLEEMAESAREGDGFLIIKDTGEVYNSTLEDIGGYGKSNILFIDSGTAYESTLKEMGNFGTRVIVLKSRYRSTKDACKNYYYHY